MRLQYHSPHPPPECAERLRAAISEPGIRRIAEHRGEWPVYGRVSEDGFYLGAIERRFGVRGRSRLSALGHLEAEFSADPVGTGSTIHVGSERPRRLRWAAVLMLVALLPLFLGGAFLARQAWDARDLQTLLLFGILALVEAFVLAAFLGPWGMGRVEREDRALLDCLTAVCEARPVDGVGEGEGEGVGVGEGDGEGEGEGVGAGEGA